ncbi:hypothetical protein [Microbacterium terrisoli]|jgi:hypothetical protein|uniref:hypothetical protein n=1 Tax=Microbacterium terrisoli TaxID=3242192 RepID=UPI0028054E63|nr:hypothetical protein [Microbacterium protaetiae]
MMHEDRTPDEAAADDELLTRLRAVWVHRDPVPSGLVDRMVAAAAASDIAREYALLTLVEGTLEAVRSDTDALTLQFSDGRTTVLLHVTECDDGHRRIDGWVDATALSVTLEQAGVERQMESGDQARFAFDDVRPGLSRILLTVRDIDGSVSGFQTPRFEV